MTVAPAPAPVPSLAARASSIGGSPVRDILAVTARPEVINFAGGLPAPELFDAEGIAPAYRAVLAESSAQALQYSTTEGEPALRAALAARTSARGLPTNADDLLVTTGSQQALSLLATALLEPGDVVLVESPCYLAALQVFALRGRAGGGRARRRGRGRPGALDGTRRAGAAQAALHRADLPEPDRPHHARRTPGRRRRGRRAARAVDRRGRPVRRAALRGRAGAVDRHVPGAPRTVRCCSVPSPRSWRPGCGSAGCARRRRCCGPASSPSRPPTCTPRPSTSSPPRGTWRTTTWTRMWRGSRACTGSGGTRCSRVWPTRCPRGRAGTVPRAACSLGAAARVVRHDGAAAAGGAARRGVRPGRALLRRGAGPSTLRLCFVTQTPEEIREGLRRLGEGLGERLKVGVDGGDGRPGPSAWSRTRTRTGS